MTVLIKFIFRAVQLICLMECFIFTAFGQNKDFPKNYFGSPLTIPLRLSGNFGEIRPNHYHSGLDIKTDSVTGKEVLAAAEGYVSRIKVSTVGFGKALYITHPNGFVTVYGHLQEFSETINKFVYADQYKKESFETELFPDSNLFCVSKGELIALSGNTGGSEGPHLHFEIRDEKTEKPVNPLFFGFAIADTVAPVVERILFREAGTSNYKVTAAVHAMGVDTVDLTGSWGLAFNGYDRINGEPNRLGVFDVMLYDGDTVIYQLKMSSFSFDETRFANAHVDFEARRLYGHTFERCYRLPGDHFSLNATNKDGFFTVLPGQHKMLRLALRDMNNNLTVRDIFIRGKEETGLSGAALSQKEKEPAEILTDRKITALKWDSLNVIRTSYMTLVIPPRALYEDGAIVYGIAKASLKKPAYARTWSISKLPPLHVNCTLSFYVPGLPLDLRHKAMLAMVQDGKILSSAGGTLKGDTMTLKTRNFGNFSIVFDTVPPTVDEYLIVQDTCSGIFQLQVKISDNLSGIASFRAAIDGSWILMEYDEKTGMLFYPLKDKEKLNNKKLTIEVIDRKENVVFYERIML